MKKRRGFIILILTLITVFVLAACGGGDSVGGGAVNDNFAPEADYRDDALYGGFSNTQRVSNVISPGEAANAVKREDAIPADRKIIRNASLEIMAEDASALYKSIVNYGAGLGGYEHSYSITNYETYSVINAEFKIPPENLGAFVNFIGESGDIINNSMTSQDITENYFDAGIRLDTKRRSLERYYQLLTSARGVEEIVYIQVIIDQITEDIESLEGRLRVWDSQINMSTVSLYIRQNNDPLQIRKEISWNTLSSDDMGYLIKQGFFSVTNTIVSVLQWIVVIFIGWSPLWILLAAGAFLWIMIRKKRKANNIPYSEGEKMPFLRFKK